MQYRFFFFYYFFFASDLIPILTLNFIGIKAPFLLLAFRQYNYDEKTGVNNIPVDPADVKRVIQEAFPKNKPPLTGEPLLRILRLVDVYTLAAILKWCWARLPGGVVTWKVYNKFKEDEKRAGMKYDAFNTIIPRCVESPVHEDIISNFFMLLVSLAASEKRNGLNGHKLARLAGAWAFELIQPNKESPTNFGEGLSCWSIAAEACYHLFLAFLRTMYPLPGENRVVTLPKSLETLLLKEQYPPKPLYKSRLITVPKITLTVGRLSANPFVLLQRVSKTIQFENPEKFNSEDDFNTLYYLFSDVNEIENRMSPESKRILEEISKENTIFSDHPLKIKDTVRLPYDVRGKTWSKFYNHAYIDPATGDPHRPLTNYVYEDHQREMILQSSLPSSERPPLPYPDSPSLNTSKPVRIGTWSEVLHYYSKSTEDKRYQNLENWSKQRKISSDNLATCTLSNIAIDDFFVWVWISSLSSEQTEVSKALFGRSVVVELQLDNGEAGRRWVVVEEILHPKPAPMKSKSNVNDIPLETNRRVVSTPVKLAKPVKVVEKLEKKPARLETKIPPVLSPAPFKPPPPVHMPEPEPEPEEPEDTTIHIHYDNFDPLVEAVVERLKRHNSDHQTQTEAVEAIQTDDPDAPPPMPTSISSDEGNNKGCQTYNYTNATTSTSSLVDTTRTTVIPTLDVPINRNDITSIHVSPKLETREAPVATLPRASGSYEEVINAIPYLNISADQDSDYMVTPILSSDVALPPTVPLVVHKKRATPSSPPSNAENFVTSIDTSYPNRRVVSMPTFRSPDDKYAPDYRQFEDSDDSVWLPSPSSPDGLYQTKSSFTTHGLKGGSRAYASQPANRTLPKPPRPAQVLDEGLFDRASSDDSQQIPRGFSLPHAHSPSSPTSSSSSGSNLRGSWGYGRENHPPSSAGNAQAQGNQPPGWGEQASGSENRQDPHSKGSARQTRDPRDARQIPRDFQQFDYEVPRGFNRPPFPDGASSSMSPSRGRYRQFGGLPDSYSEIALPRGSNNGPPHPFRPVATLAPDDMIMDSTLGSRSQNFNRPRPGPTRPGPVYQSSPEGYKDFGYGSDSNYRYDANERAKASPDSGYANLPRANSHRFNAYSNNGSDSDVSRGSIGPSAFSQQRQRSNSNRDFSLPPPLIQNQTRVMSNPERNTSGNTSISPQFRPTQDMINTQPRTNPVPLPFAESPLKSVSTSSVHAPPPNTLPSTGQQLPAMLTHPNLVPSTDQQISSTLSHPNPVQPVMSTVSYTSIPSQSFKPPTASLLDDQPRSLASGGSARSNSSKWSEIQSNLSAMSQQNTLDKNKLPAVIEVNPKNPTSAQTLVGATSPDDYYNATVSTMRRPSINTGDHVKNIIMKDNLSPNVIGKVPSSSNYPFSSTKPTSGTLGGNEESSVYSDDDDESSANDFTTAFLPTDSAKAENIYQFTPRRPIQEPMLPEPESDPLNERALYQSTRHDLLGGYQIGRSTSEPRREQPQYQQNRHSFQAGPSGSGAPSQSQFQKSSGSTRRVSKYSIQGFIDRSKKKKEKEQEKQ